MSTPSPTDTFDRLPLPPAVLENLQRLGFERMTPIQAASLPLGLAGRDLIARSRTGSGKTLAFALPLLQRLDPRRRVVQGLVLCPTRELADQVSQELRRLARSEDNIKLLTLSGGGALRPQTSSLAHGAHVVVGTPGRILDHLDRGHLELGALQTLVLDEADRMLDMGFAEDLQRLIGHCPALRQTLLFSATYPADVAQLAARHLQDPARVEVDDPHESDTLQERFIEVTEAQRLHAVGLLLNHHRPVRTLAFCNTKQRCRELTALLQAQGLVALELHGDLEQRERDQVLIQFAHGSCSVLVATDVAARGLDIGQLEAVINVELSPDLDVHTHRIGRTARAGAAGWAFSLVSLDDMGRVGRLEAARGRAVEWLPLSACSAPEAAPTEPLRPPWVTLQIAGGRKEKIRAGDVLGALTKDLGFEARLVGKIDVNAYATYVAVDRGIARDVLRGLDGGKVKGKTVKVRRL